MAMYRHFCGSEGGFGSCLYVNFLLSRKAPFQPLCYAVCRDRIDLWVCPVGDGNPSALPMYEYVSYY